MLKSWEDQLCVKKKITLWSLYIDHITDAPDAQKDLETDKFDNGSVDLVLKNHDDQDGGDPIGGKICSKMLMQ